MRKSPNSVTATMSVPPPQRIRLVRNTTRACRLNRRRLARQGADLKAQSELVPLLKGKVAKKGKATAYVCQGGVCKLPTTDVATFVEQLERPRGQEPDAPIRLPYIPTD